MMHLRRLCDNLKKYVTPKISPKVTDKLVTHGNGDVCYTSILSNINRL